MAWTKLAAGRPNCIGICRLIRYETNPMKTQLKLVSCFVAMAMVCGSLCFSASVLAQAAPAPTEDPYANKKEAPVNATPAPSATPTPKK